MPLNQITQHNLKMATSAQSAGDVEYVYYISAKG